MIPEIFKMDGDEVVLNPNILTIPDYNQLWEYCHDLTWFSYLRNMYHPESSFANLDEDKKKEVLNKMYPNVDIYCPEYCMAKDLFEAQCITPTKKIYTATKIAADKLLEYYINTDPTDGRDGNKDGFERFILKSESIMKAMAATETAYKEELISSRGGEETTDDENTDYESDDYSI